MFNLIYVFLASGNDYIDLPLTRLRLKVQILNENGTQLGENAKVGPANLFLHTLFSNIQIELNQKQISSNGANYSYRAMIETLLNYGNDAKESHLTSSLYLPDTPGRMEAVEANHGFAARKKRILKGEIELEGPLHLDILNVNKLLLNNVQIVIKLHKNKPEFSLMTEAADALKYIIKISEATLVIRKLKLSTAVMVAHQNALMHANAR